MWKIEDDEPVRISVSDALHCFFARHLHADRATLRMYNRIARRFKMRSIHQAPYTLPRSIWRALYMRFPKDMSRSEIDAVRRLAADFEAEKAAERARTAIDAVMQKNTAPSP